MWIQFFRPSATRRLSFPRNRTRIVDLLRKRMIDARANQEESRLSIVAMDTMETL